MHNGFSLYLMNLSTYQSHNDYNWLKIITQNSLSTFNIQSINYPMIVVKESGMWCSLFQNKTSTFWHKREDVSK